MTPESINYAIGDQFDIQFVWELPNRDYLRAVFLANVSGLDTFANRYIIDLVELRAGRQEAPNGSMRPIEDTDQYHWGLAKALVGRKAEIAYEAADGKPIRLRIATLTREHSYFTRYD